MTESLICFSHLRWRFVYQRPQHLLSRFANVTRVFVLEEPIFDASSDHLAGSQESDNLWVLTPHLRGGLPEEEITSIQKNLLDQFMEEMSIRDYTLWYYSPMALRFSDHLTPSLIVYDCMDELSAFRFAPPQLTMLDTVLMQKADLVFTGGQSLYEARKNRHHAIYPFPSSIDKHHFLSARQYKIEQDDQASIPHPRLGFYGVLDERLNLQLIEDMAALRQHWHFIYIGPVVKIDPDTLPRAANIHYLGGKEYSDLPKYLAGWDIAIMPFALNESTRFISPTKTPEFLSAGKPVISTSITDVVNPYQKKGLVHIADTAEEFVEAADEALTNGTSSEWLKNVDDFLAEISWDHTWERMYVLMNERLEQKKISKTHKSMIHV